jgi:hypothetical protein
MPPNMVLQLTPLCGEQDRAILRSWNWLERIPDQ